MTGLDAGREQGLPEDEEISLLAWGIVLLRWRRMIFALGAIGSLLGLAAALLSTRMYTSAATFIPQGPEGGSVSSLTLAASQFGIRVPSAGGGWGTPVYVELLTSRALLEPIALDTLLVTEQGGRRVSVMELMSVKATNPARRTERAILDLGKLISATEDKKIGAVRVKVTTRWSSVSLALAERLVSGVNQFNLKMRKSQALAERQFVEARAMEAEGALREAENQLQVFLQRNRTINSPELSFERDRLQREVVMRQQMYASLAQNREEARIREVRDTPVITILETPTLSAGGEPRKVISKTMLGGLMGVILGILAAFILPALDALKHSPNTEAQEFITLVRDSAPGFLRRKTQ